MVAQSLSLPAFEELMNDATAIAEACGRPFRDPRVVPFVKKTAEGAI